VPALLFVLDAWEEEATPMEPEARPAPGVAALEYAGALAPKLLPDIHLTLGGW
jgi:hypothetical protein